MLASLVEDILIQVYRDVLIQCSEVFIVTMGLKLPRMSPLKVVFAFLVSIGSTILHGCAQFVWWVVSFRDC